MRLIDADELVKRFSDSKCGKNLKTMVDTQPTAYNVDQVVEEIEKIRMVCYLTMGNTGNECYDTAYIEICKVIEQIEKIVKRGGLNE